jgi:hypothetical protein
VISLDFIRLGAVAITYTIPGNVTDSRHGSKHMNINDVVSWADGLLDEWMERLPGR